MRLRSRNPRRHDVVRRRVAGVAAIVLFALVAYSTAAGQGGTAGEGGRIHWKQLPMAQIKVDDKTPLKWNVYQPDKKDRKDRKKDSDLVMVLLGHRYLMLDTKAHLVFVVPLSELQAQGQDFESGDLAQQKYLVPSTDWSSRDVGPAELIHLTLGDYGRELEVSLPHMPDLRPFY